MERSSATRASRTTLGLLVAGPLLAVLVVARALPATDLSEAGLAWAPAVLAGLLVVAAAAAALAWLVAGLRGGSISDLMMAGASAAVAGGALAVLSGASHVLPMVAAGAGLLAAASSDRMRLTIDGQVPRVVVAVAAVGIAELAVLAELLPGLGGDLPAVHPIVAGGGLVIAVLAAIVGVNRPASPVASALLVGIAAATVARDGGIEVVIGLAALIGSQVIALIARIELLSATDTVAEGPEPDRLPDLAGRLGDAVLRFDGRLRLRDWNPAATALLGLDSSSGGARLEDLLGMPISALPPDDGSAAIIAGVGGLTVDIQRTGGGLTAIIRDPGASPDAERLGRELRGTIEELLQARRTIELQRQEIERASTVDPLTGVASRSAILERLRIEVAQARRYLHPVAVVLLDLDGFAEINRQHGTDGGDAALRELALRIRLRVREADELGRIGSDSFLAILPHTEEGGAATFADALQHRLGLRAVSVGGAEMMLTVSIGVAVMRGGDELDVDGLLARAHEALASAKRAGGNRIALDRLHGLARLEDHRAPGRPSEDAADDADS